MTSNEGVAQQPAIAAAIITHGRKVLLVKRRVSEGQLSWQFPAGAIEKDESAETAAVREAREETGLIVEAGSLLGERTHPSTGRVMVYVACRVVVGHADAYVGDTEELSDLAWSSLDDLADYVPHGLFEPVQQHLNITLAE